MNEAVLIGDEALLSQFPEITDSIPSLAISLSIDKSLTAPTARFLPNRFYTSGTSELFPTMEDAFLNSGVLTPRGPNAYTFDNISRSHIIGRFDLDSLGTISASDRESIICGITTSSQAGVPWVYVAVSEKFIWDAKVWNVLADNLRETGARLCVVDLHQWRQDFKSTSSYRVKI